MTSSLWAMRMGLFILGFAAGLYIPSAIATITSLIARPHWGKAIAVHELAPNLAFFAGPFVAELFLDWSTWRVARVLWGLPRLSRVLRICTLVGEVSLPVNRQDRMLLIADSLGIVLDHGSAISFGSKLDDRCLCHAAALSC